MTFQDREEVLEALAFAVDLVRDAMTTAEARQGRGSLYRALRDFEAAGIRAHSVALVTMARSQPMAAA